MRGDDSSQPAAPRPAEAKRADLVDRRTLSKRRLRQGIRCYRGYAPEVGLPEMLSALGYQGTTEEALSKFLGELVADYERWLDSDMSLRGSFRCAVLPDERF